MNKSAIQSILLILCLTTVTTFAAPNAKIVASKDELRTFLQTANATLTSKLIFHDNGSIFYIDFFEETPQIREIIAARGGKLTVISPDGKYFVFAKGVAGDGEEVNPCTTFFCQLTENATPIQVATPAYVPRFVQNANNPTVLYSTCGKHPQSGKFTFEDGCGSVLKKEFVNGSFNAPDTVWAHGSYFGGLSYDGKYLGTAWLASGKSYINNIGATQPQIKMIHLKVKNSVTNSDTTFAIGGCNPSISSSRKYTDAMMFVDFGYDQSVPAPYVFPFQSAWEQHEFIFISNYSADILRRIGQVFVPELTEDQFLALSWADTKGQSVGSAWENPEWSNHPYLAVASTLVNRTWKKSNTTSEFDDKSLNEKICLINIKNQSTLTLVSTSDSSYTSKTNFQWPWFWTQIPDGFVEEDGWLTKTNTIQSHYKKFHSNSIHVDRNVIKSSKTIKKISIYGLNGHCLWHVNLNYKSTTLPEEIINENNNVFLIHAVLIDNSTETIKLTSVQN